MVHQLNPIQDPRWSEFISRHPRASVFHGPAWLAALERTYGYEPVVFTTAVPGAALGDGIVMCRVQSLLTGRRLVSLPFSDHCEPLVDNPADFCELLEGIELELKNGGWKYAELRPVTHGLDGQAGFHQSEDFVLHRLDISSPPAVLLRTFHKDCIQRKIKRAQNEQLAYESGTSPQLLASFYRMFLGTRRRHKVPPQPLAWFQQLAESFGDSLQVRLAFKDGRPIAGILTLKFSKTLTYKYGCSDAAFNNTGCTPFLFWKAIEEASAEGMTELDLGRSDTTNPGLIEFKDRWGAQRSALTYWRYPGTEKQPAGAKWPTDVAGRAFERMPDWLLVASGKLLYRHMG